MDKRRWWSLSLLNSRFPALHGLRVLAIFLVVQLHVTDAIVHEMPDTPPGIVPKSWLALLSFNAWFAMDLFFIMSGFLIGHILIYSFSKSSNGTFKRFWLRRSFRTFPLYYIFFFGYYFLNKLVPVAVPVSKVGFHEITYNELLYLTNYPFEPWRYLVYWSWSLSLEEHFYLIAPVFIFLMMKLKTHRARFTLLGLTWIAGFLVRLGIVGWFIRVAPESLVTIRDIYTPTHARFDILVAGIFIAYLNFFFAEQVRAFLRRRWVVPTLTMIAIAGFSVMLSPQINPTPLGLVDLNHLDYLLYTSKLGVFYFGTLTSIVYVCTIVPCLYIENRLTRWLGHRSFLQIATLGYGIYLVHMPIIYQLQTLAIKILPSPENSFGLHWLILTPLALILSSFLAYLLHLVVEKPSLFLRDRFFP